MKDRIIKYGELVMFSHTIFSLPFAIFAYLLAVDGIIDLRILILAIICLFGGRNGANAWNRIADYKIDLANSRTANRHLQTGEVSMVEAYIMMIIFYFIYFIGAYLISPVCFILSPIPVILFTIYPFTKRFTFLCHLFLGFCCAIAIPAAYIAGGNMLLDVCTNLEGISIFGYCINLTPIVMFIAIMLWNAGFDTIYGTQDYEHDVEHNIFSLASKFGVKKALFLAKIFHLIMMLLLFLLIFINPSLSLIYGIGLVLGGFVLIIEHNVVDIKNENLMKLASYKLNQVISVTICLFGIIDIYF